MNVRVLIADDEAPARRKLERLLTHHRDLELVAEASTGAEAVDLCTATEPHLIFLDIAMPELDGLGVATSLARADTPPVIVFVTAFDRYAVEAFDHSAIDYLLKPYDRDRFERALERARRSLTGPPLDAVRFADLVARARREVDYVRRILVPNDGRSFFVRIANIIRFEADGNNVRIHTRDGIHAIRATLDSIEARLDPQAFARVHRSDIVNLDEIGEIASWFHGDYKLRLRDGTELAWSRRYVERRPDILK